MIIKIDRDVRMNEEQLKKLPLVLNKPDIGWEVDNNHQPLPKVYEVIQITCYGTYTFRVNLSWNMITLLDVK